MIPCFAVRFCFTETGIDRTDSTCNLIRVEVFGAHGEEHGARDAALSRAVGSCQDINRACPVQGRFWRLNAYYRYIYLIIFDCLPRWSPADRFCPFRCRVIRFSDTLLLTSFVLLFCSIGSVPASSLWPAPCLCSWPSAAAQSPTDCAPSRSTPLRPLDSYAPCSTAAAPEIRS